MGGASSSGSGTQTSPRMVSYHEGLHVASLARLERLAVVLDDDVRVAQAVLVLGGEEARHVEVEAHLVLLLLPLDELAAAAYLGHVGVRAERDGTEEEARDVPRLEGVQAGLLDELQPLGHKVAAVDLRLGDREQLHGRPAQVGDVLAAAHEVDENVGELRPARARGGSLNGGEHELQVVHGLVEEGAAVAHVLGLRVGLDLADADLDLHALAPAQEAAAAVVEGHVRGLVEVAAQRVARLGDLLVGPLAQLHVVEAARLLLVRHELAQVVALGIGHHVLVDGGQRAVDGQVVRAALSAEVDALPDAHQQPAAEEGAGAAAVVHRVGDERRAHPRGVVGLGRRAVEVDPVGEEVTDDGRARGARGGLHERLEGEADGADGVVGADHVVVPHRERDHVHHGGPHDGHLELLLPHGFARARDVGRLDGLVVAELQLHVRVDAAEAEGRGEVERHHSVAADDLRAADRLALDDVRRREDVAELGDAVLEAEALFDVVAVLVRGHLVAVDEDGDVDAQVAVLLIALARRVHEGAPLLEVLVVLARVDHAQVEVKLADHHVALRDVGVLHHDREDAHLGLARRQARLAEDHRVVPNGVERVDLAVGVLVHGDDRAGELQLGQHDRVGGAVLLVDRLKVTGLDDVDDDLVVAIHQLVADLVAPADLGRLTLGVGRARHAAGACGVPEHVQTSDIEVQIHGGSKCLL